MFNHPDTQSYFNKMTHFDQKTLLPALLHATETGKKVIISTRTKALQEQLDRRDLPFLQAVLGREFTWAMGVGRNNYVCLRRLERASRET